MHVITILLYDTFYQFLLFLFTSCYVIIRALWTVPRNRKKYEAHNDQTNIEENSFKTTEETIITDQLRCRLPLSGKESTSIIPIPLLFVNDRKHIFISKPYCFLKIFYKNFIILKTKINVLLRQHCINT